MQTNTSEGNQGNWVYKPGEDSQYEPPSAPATELEPVQWTASEFISHQKNGSWYAMLGGGFVIFSALIYIFTKDIMSIIFIGIVLILFLIIAGKKPQQRTYVLDSHGIAIDSKFYPYSDFKSFSIGNEGAIGSAVFMPLKRFMPELTVYFAPDDGLRIVDTLAAHLPNDQRNERSIDRFMSRLHF